MRFTIRLAFGLAIFLALAGIVYAVTADERLGTVLLLVCATASVYIGVSLRMADRRAAEESKQGEGPGELEEVEGTIWPFVLSIGAVLLVIGAVATPWVLILAIVVLAGGGTGWFFDIQRQRVHASAGYEGAHPTRDAPDAGPGA